MRAPPLLPLLSKRLRHLQAAVRKRLRHLQAAVSKRLLAAARTR